MTPNSTLPVESSVEAVDVPLGPMSVPVLSVIRSWPWSTGRAKSGGLSRKLDLSSRFEDTRPDDAPSLDHLLQTHALLSFEWNSVTWVPMFQLDRVKLAIKPSVQALIAELGTELGDWETALWFATPNPELHGRRPVAIVDWSLAQVARAAEKTRAEHEGVRTSQIMLL